MILICGPGKWKRNRHLCESLLTCAYNLNVTKSISLVSFATENYYDVWNLSAEVLPKFVDANSYRIYVPEKQLSKFESRASAFSVFSGTELGKNFSINLRKIVERSNNSERFGWYLQQFLKIQSLIDSDSDVTIIWDVDCVPVNSVNLVDDTGNLRFMKSKEFHKPYFDSIEKLLGMNRIVNHSFIVPGFPMKRDWINEFIFEIENNHRVPWYEAIFNSTDFSLKSGFAEFETLGTWITHRKMEEISYLSLNWERYGQSKFGFPKDLTYSDLDLIQKKYKLDLITFETWDKPGFSRVLRAIKGKLIISRHVIVKFFLKLVKP